MKSSLALLLLPCALAACAGNHAPGTGLTQTSARAATFVPAYHLIRSNDGTVTIQYDSTRTTPSSMLQVAQTACSKLHRDADLKSAVQGSQPNIKVALYRCQGGHSYR